MLAELILCSYDERSTAVLNNAVDTVGGVLWVAWDKRCACFINAKHTAEEAAFSWQQQNNAVPCFNALAYKLIGNDICTLVQLTVCHCSVLCNKGSLFRIFPHALLKQLMQEQR